MLNDNEVRERINYLLSLDSKSEQKEQLEKYIKAIYVMGYCEGRMDGQEQLLEYARKCWWGDWMNKFHIEDLFVVFVVVLFCLLGIFGV